MKKTVVITRVQGPYGGSRKLAQKLEARGFESFELPILECELIEPSQEALQVIKATFLSPVRWIAFLSPTAVHAFRQLMDRYLASADLPKAVMFAAQGTGTAEAVRECFGRDPDYIPPVFVAEEFARSFAERISHDQSVLVPQSAEGRDILVPTMLSFGKKAASFNLYRVRTSRVKPEVRNAFSLLANETTLLVFMSPSAVRAAVEELGEELQGKRVVSVGPITSNEARKAGLSVWREAEEYSEEGVLRALDGA